MDWLTGLIRSGLPSEGEIYTEDVSGEIAEVIREAIGKKGEEYLGELKKSPNYYCREIQAVRKLLRRLE